MLPINIQSSFLHLSPFYLQKQDRSLPSAGEFTPRWENLRVQFPFLPPVAHPHPHKHMVQVAQQDCAWECRMECFSDMVQGTWLLP